MGSFMWVQGSKHVGISREPGAGAQEECWTGRHLLQHVAGPHVLLDLPASHPDATAGSSCSSVSGLLGNVCAVPPMSRFSRLCPGLRVLHTLTSSSFLPCDCSVGPLLIKDSQIFFFAVVLGAWVQVSELAPPLFLKDNILWTGMTSA